MSGERDDDFDPEGAEAEAFALLAGALPAPEPPRAQRDRLLAELRGRERFAPFVDEVVHAFGVTSDTLRAAFARVADGAGWQPGLWPDSRLLQTPELARANVVIAELAPGSVIPAHDHVVRELTYVLDGELIEDGTRRLGPGELLELQPGMRHAISVSSDSPCLVVFGLQRV